MNKTLTEPIIHQQTGQLRRNAWIPKNTHNLLRPKHGSIISNNQGMEATYVFVHDKQNVIYIYTFKHICVYM